jgi:hypothetical protein
MYPEFFAVLASVCQQGNNEKKEAAATEEVVATDRKERSRKIPSRYQIKQVERWLYSFSMEFRRGRCKPPLSCRFLIDWLDDELRKEFEVKGDLRWRDWNFCYGQIP